MAKITKKDKRRLIIWSMLILVIASYLAVFTHQYWSQIFENNQNRAELYRQYRELQDQEEELNTQFTRLQDPDFVARFARERFLYSRAGELIIKIAD